MSCSGVDEAEGAAKGATNLREVFAMAHVARQGRGVSQWGMCRVVRLGVGWGWGGEKSAGAGIVANERDEGSDIGWWHGHAAV